MHMHDVLAVDLTVRYDSVSGGRSWVWFIPVHVCNVCRSILFYFLGSTP